MIRTSLFKLFLTVCLLNGFSQTGTVKGRIYNALSNEPVPFATVLVGDTGAIADLDGLFILSDLPVGLINVQVTAVGYQSTEQAEVEISTAAVLNLDFALNPQATDIDAIQVVASPYTEAEEAPLSLRSLGSAEISRNPGGNRDISKVLRSFPGVGSTASFRNDIIIRGGAPNENRFFLDGIEVPNINHFATQGSSGGPVGMLNVEFIREVEFYSGAFPASRGNALSSVLEFKQVNGNDERLVKTLTVGSSDFGVTLDGPIGRKSTFILSARRSYLEFLFKALALPFLPTYNDFQFKQRWTPDLKNQITVIGLGAIDQFKLNESVNKNITDQELIDRNNYILGNLPVNTQWNYTVGASWKHFFQDGYVTTVASRSHLKNKANKYADNIETPENLLLDYESEEIENKLRFEHTLRAGDWKIQYGAGYEYAIYLNATYQQLVSGGAVIERDFNSRLTMNKGSAFGQVSGGLGPRVRVSAGIRTDVNDYSPKMSNPLTQLSPRVSLSYVVADKWRLNANAGRYFQLPPYTVLGFRDSSDILINKVNEVSYIRADHLVAGIEHRPSKYARVTVEGFYKKYSGYPLLLGDSISLANLGGDFGVIGNEPITPVSAGRSYGVEVLAQQKLATSVYGVVAYTFVRSEFTNGDGEYSPSSWDNVHILSATGGKRFQRNWEVGVKLRVAGGSPYTPYDDDLSARQAIWDVRQQGVLDWARTNEERLGWNHGLDIRVDKKWFFSKWSLNVYLDLENIYNFQAEAVPFLDVIRDANGSPVADPQRPGYYQTRLIENTAGTILPSVGLKIEL